MSSLGMHIFEIQNSRESEETPLAMEQVFASLSGAGSHGLLSRLFGGHTSSPFIVLKLYRSIPKFIFS